MKRSFHYDKVCFVQCPIPNFLRCYRRVNGTPYNGQELSMFLPLPLRGSRAVLSTIESPRHEIRDYRLSFLVYSPCFVLRDACEMWVDRHLWRKCSPIDRSGSKRVLTKLLPVEVVDQVKCLISPASPSLLPDLLRVRHLVICKHLVDCHCDRFSSRPKFLIPCRERDSKTETCNYGVKTPTWTLLWILSSSSLETVTCFEFFLSLKLLLTQFVTPLLVRQKLFLYDAICF